MTRLRVRGGGGYLRGDMPPRKLEICVFLELKSCNLVNTFRCKFRAGDEEKNTVLWA